MATSQIASMLDELMGRNRNFAPDDAKARELKWTDADVCKYYIVQFCPHDLFTNTKADLGTCGKIHDDALKSKFEEEDERESYKKGQYIDDFLRFCQRMLSDLSSRIKRAKERLALTQEKEERFREQMAQQAAEAGTGINKEADEKILLLSEKITALVAEAETAGCSGNVEQAQGLLKLSDQLREEREQIRKALTMNAQNLPASLREEYVAQQKAMEVCDTCGAFLIVGDAQQRIDDHLLGKQHVGYARLRAAVDRILDERRKVREERDKEMDDRRKKREDDAKKEADDRRRQRDRERDSSHRESRDKERESNSRRDRDARSERDRERYPRERSRDRDQVKRSSRDERNKGSRERDRRERRSHDTDWERDRGSSRKRSRSRERRRSRSRDRKRSKSKERRSRSRNRSRERSRRERSKDQSSRERAGGVEKGRSSRSNSRSREKKGMTEEDNNVSQNSSGAQHRSRSRSKSKESGGSRYTSDNAETRKERKKNISNDAEFNEYKAESSSSRKTISDDHKKANGLLP